MAINIKNFTPHDCHLLNEDGMVVETFRSVGNARCRQLTVSDEALSEKTGYPITRTSFGVVEGLPAPAADTYYLVSRIVMSAEADRRDLLVPNDIVRDGAGNVIGCKSFANN